MNFAHCKASPVDCRNGTIVSIIEFEQQILACNTSYFKTVISHKVL